MSTVKSYRVYNTDDVMRKLWLHLHRDFACTTDSTRKVDKRKDLVKTGRIDLFRNFPHPYIHQATPYIFKTEYQLATLFKRYRFEHDLYKDDDLESLTNAKFHENQLEICTKLMKPRRCSTFTVLQKARRIVKEVLGPYSPEIHAQLCRFGTRATVGNPMAQSYLDSKTRGPITGSVKHHKWFEQHLHHDALLSGILSRNKRVVCDTLVQTNVPKSYKIKRGICPNTLVGSFHSAGLGKYIEIQLRRNSPIDIRKQPVLHGKLARTGSLNRNLVTADLSSASNSFTSRHIMELLPRDWFRALNLGRIRYVSMDGKRYSNASFMAMGIGFTFPLQTLLFYSVLLAVKELTGISGPLSVFGDDLIYPRTMHKYVVPIFNDWGFTFNADKTFVKDHFRESCGNDYFHGCAVRPFQPEGVSANLSTSKFLAFLYKMHNGLCERWTEEEVPTALRYLKKEILRVSQVIHQVPSTYPSFSGIRTFDFKESCIEWPMSRPYVVRDKHGSDNIRIFVERLGYTPGRRALTQLDIYAWDWLRSKHLQTNFGIDEIEDFEAFESDWRTASRPSIRWVPIKRWTHPRRGQGFFIPGSVRVTIPCIASKNVRLARYICQSGEMFLHRRP